jgi:hypothetical protein
MFCTFVSLFCVIHVMYGRDGCPKLYLVIHQLQLTLSSSLSKFQGCCRAVHVLTWLGRSDSNRSVLFTNKILSATECIESAFIESDSLIVNLSLHHHAHVHQTEPSSTSAAAASIHLLPIMISHLYLRWKLHYVRYWWPKGEFAANCSRQSSYLSAVQCS